MDPLQYRWWYILYILEKEMTEIKYKSYIFIILWYLQFLSLFRPLSLSLKYRECITNAGKYPDPYILYYLYTNIWWVYKYFCMKPNQEVNISNKTRFLCDITYRLSSKHILRSSCEYFATIYVWEYLSTMAKRILVTTMITECTSIRCWQKAKNG